MLPPPFFTVEMVLGFLQTWRLAFRPNSSILVSSDQRILFIMICESLGAFWQTPSGLSCAFYWGASIWPLDHKGLIVGVLQRLLSFWKVLPSPQTNSRALSEWPLGSWSPPWPRPFSPDCSVWPCRPALGRVLEVPNVFHLRRMCSWGPSIIFLYPSPYLCFDTILSRSSTDNSCNFMACFLLWHALSTVRPYI